MANDETLFGEVAFGVDDPIPVSIGMTSPATVLTASAPSAQLVTTGKLVNGAEVDVTSSTTGTFYLSSNRNIATVSSDGLVTAIGSGRVIITATHEGVVGTIALKASLSTDADGDGLPDDFEELNRVNTGGSNLVRLPGVQANASSASGGFSASRAIDGSLLTSWLAASGNAANRGNAPFIELVLPTDRGVAQVRLRGNRENPNGFDFFAGIFQAFDASGREIFNSGEVLLPAPNRDVTVPLDLNGVRRVRFTSTADEGNTPGLSEIEVISRAGGAGLDPKNGSDGTADFDQDGLTNFQEFNLGTSIFLNDTDSDGLLDSQEPGLGSNPLLADTDRDGLIDGSEVNLGSDTDGDGVINVRDSDSDNDGLPDGIEVRLGLSPIRVDSNGNGLADGSEDSDGDRLPNGEEVLEGLDPGNPDTDGDGLADGQEILGVTDPRDPDSDDDGAIDGLEIELGSNPLDPNSRPNTQLSSLTAVTPAFSLLNTRDPSRPVEGQPIDPALFVGEAGSLAVSVLNQRDPSQPPEGQPIDPTLFVGEAGSLAVSVLNRKDPSQPPEGQPIDPTLFVGEAGSLAVSMLNQRDPSQPPEGQPIDPTLFVGETGSLAVSVLNLADPSQPPQGQPVDPSLFVGEAVGPAFSVLGVANAKDFDGDGLSNSYELRNGLNPYDPSDAARDADQDGLSNLQEFALRTDPRRADTDGDGIRDGEEVLNGQDPLAREVTPPTVAVIQPIAGATLIAGQTLTIRAEAADNVAVSNVELAVNGAVFTRDEAPPYDLTFTVPFGVAGLTLRASARDVAGNVATSAEVPVSVVPDALTTVRGRVVDAEGNPMAGAAVRLDLQGLRAEFFDSGAPLDSLPDLRGRTSERTKLVSAVNFRNPENLFGTATFSEDFGPDFAARFSGLLRIPKPGRYTFILGADDAARLYLGGKRVVETAAADALSEAITTVDLPAGDVPILIEYFQSTGDAELQLSWVPPGGERQVVPLSALRQAPATFAASTAADGSFSMANVPTILGGISVWTTSTLPGGGVQSGRSASTPPRPDGVTDVGTLPLSSGERRPL